MELINTVRILLLAWVLFLSELWELEFERTLLVPLTTFLFRYVAAISGIPPDRPSRIHLIRYLGNSHRFEITWWLVMFFFCYHRLDKIKFFALGANIAIAISVVMEKLHILDIL